MNRAKIVSTLALRPRFPLPSGYLRLFRPLLLRSFEPFVSLEGCLSRGGPAFLESAIVSLIARAALPAG